MKPLLLTFIVLLLASCQKPTRDNPWDELAGLDPQLWSLKNLQIDTISATERNLSWQYDGDERIEGFKVERKRGNESWISLYKVLSKSSRNLTDTLTPVSSIVYQYRIYAYAGKNNSIPVDTSFTAKIPVPANLSINVISSSNISLSWEYNTTGIQGFKLERKTNNGAWTTLSNNISPDVFSFTDSQINLEQNDYAFRLSAFVQNGFSDFAVTDLSKPSLTTTSVSNIEASSAVAGGNITEQGSTSVSQRGVCWSINQNPTVNDNFTNDGSGTGSFTSQMTSLNPLTTYYVRAYAINTIGTTYGTQLEFTTLGIAPIAAFSADPTTGTAPLTINFSDQSSFNPTSWLWDFGDGNTSSLQNPAHMYQSAGKYNVQLTVNNAYGSDSELLVNFINLTYILGGIPCPETPTVTDVEGNIYNTVLIGNQCWFKEDLKTTRYRNNASIEYPGNNNTAWQNNTSGAYAWYDNDIAWKNMYGALYNWYAVNNSNGLCPSGWHVPSDAESTQLVDFIISLGFPNNDVNIGAGYALKSCRQINSPLEGECNTVIHPRWEESTAFHGFNEVGFSNLPGGARSENGSFSAQGYDGTWWTSTQSSTSMAWYRYLLCNFGNVTRFGNDKGNGFSVRCIKD